MARPGREWGDDAAAAIPDQLFRSGTAGPLVRTSEDHRAWASSSRGRTARIDRAGTRPPRPRLVGTWNSGPGFAKLHVELLLEDEAEPARSAGSPCA